MEGSTGAPLELDELPEAPLELELELDELPEEPLEPDELPEAPPEVLLPLVDAPAPLAPGTAADVAGVVAGSVGNVPLLSSVDEQANAAPNPNIPKTCSVRTRACMRIEVSRGMTEAGFVRAPDPDRLSRNHAQLRRRRDRDARGVRGAKAERGNYVVTASREWGTARRRGPRHSRAP